MAPQTAMSAKDLAAWLAVHPSWALDGGKLIRTYRAKTFPEAIEFVRQVALAAESLNHHPDIDIRYVNVTLRLATHDAGDAVTTMDIRLATECDKRFHSANSEG